MSVTVVLTATVNPFAGTTNAASGDERRLEYQRSLARWSRSMQLDGVSVVLLENSGEDLSAWPVTGAKLFARPKPTAEAIRRGKGAMEAEMLEGYLAESPHQALDLIVKCTGRLYVRNLRRALPEASGPQLVIRTTIDLSTADSRVFAATANVWRNHLAMMSHDVDERQGIWLEHVLARRVAGILAESTARVARFVVPPALVGRSGSSGLSYNSLGAAIRRVAHAPIDWFLNRFSSRKFY